PTPTMDPTRESTYRFLEKFFGEMATLFPYAYVHFGCDENNGVAWAKNPSIESFMKKNNLPDAHALQAYFANRVTKILTKLNKKAIGWEEILSGNISSDVIVQVWNNATYLKKALEANHPVLMSKGFYLDHFMPAYVHYQNEMIPSDSSSILIYGGEAAMWAEAVDKNNIDTRIWPRAGAIAERLWSPASVTNIDDLYRRLFILNRQLDDLGLQQITEYERSLRRLAGEKDPMPLKTLTDVLTPVKGYKKMFGKIGKPEGYFFQTAPLIAVSDIIPVDNEARWNFRNLVAEYLHTINANAEKKIIDILTKWHDNKDLLAPYFEGSELLAEVKQQSENLSEAASIGLEAITKIKNGSQPSQEWISEKINRLKELRKSYGETDLAILPEIE
ncbi:MAG TPA: family 20 glycosylhydrolase, partial [Puia sp.]|nr:family 20 glycosylhydrolase [Puia sp.]